MKSLIVFLMLLGAAHDTTHIEDLFKRASRWRVGSAIKEVESARDTIKSLGDSVVLYILKKHIKTDETLELRALKAIMKEKHPLYMDALRDYITDSNDTVRLSAIYLAGELKDTGSIDNLIKAVKDTSLRVKLNAMLSIGKIGDTTYGNILCENLSKAGKDDRVKIVAMRSLARMKYSGCVKSVLRNLDGEKSVVRYAAVNTLSKMGRPAFLSLIKRENDNIDFYGLYALLELVKNDTALSLEDSILARKVFTSAFEKDDPATRILAVRGLYRVMGSGGREILKKWLFYEKSPDVRFVIKRCIEK